MPETYNKRQRQDVRTRKLAAREARRVARKARKDQGPGGDDALALGPDDSAEKLD